MGIGLWPNEEISKLAWLAGLLEGEGYFSLQKSRRGIIMGLKMADRDVVATAAAMLGNPKIYIKVPKLTDKHYGKKPLYYFQLCNRKAFDACQRLLPLMHTRRRGQIEKLLLKYGSTWDC